MRYAFRRRLFTAVCVVFATYSSSAQQVLLHGDVRDTVGAAIKGAYIMVRADRAGGFGIGNVDQNLISDIGGRFQVSARLGFYDICVMADAFTPQCRKIFIKQSAQLDQHFRLKMDPEVEKHIGDKF